jgi:dTDP-4-amino-4,6-dideoxygalactose transaminase
MYYLICENIEERSSFLKFLKEEGILAVFHYLSLHKSKFFEDSYQGQELYQSDRYSNSLVRLPFFPELSMQQQDLVISKILFYYKNRKSHNN